MSAQVPSGERSRFRPMGQTNWAGELSADRTSSDGRRAPRQTAPAWPEEPPGPSVSQAAPVDHYVDIQDRLRQMGATQCLLESWGNQKQLYRFCCKMAVEGSPNYTRYFEATDSDPLRTMSQVLRQVEAWRAGRQ